MASEHLIFVGFELTETVSEMIEACADRDRAYLEDPAFLEIVFIDEKQYVGKRVKEGVAIDRIEDTARSVVSLLTRVNGDWSMGANQARILAVEEDGAKPPGATNAGFDYSDLV